jgi:hypothetical protein
MRLTLGGTPNESKLCRLKYPGNNRSVWAGKLRPGCATGAIAKATSSWRSGRPISGGSTCGGNRAAEVRPLQTRPAALRRSACEIPGRVRPKRKHPLALLASKKSRLRKLGYLRGNALAVRPLTRLETSGIWGIKLAFPRQLIIPVSLRRPILPHRHERDAKCRGRRGAIF